MDLMEHPESRRNHGFWIFCASLTTGIFLSFPSINNYHPNLYNACPEVGGRETAWSGLTSLEVHHLPCGCWQVPRPEKGVEVGGAVVQKKASFPGWWLSFTQNGCCTCSERLHDVGFSCAHHGLFQLMSIEPTPSLLRDACPAWKRFLLNSET